MLDWTAEKLAALPPRELTNVLADLGDKARRAAIDGNTDFLRDLRRVLIEAADAARGESVRLLVVARAFIRDLGRMELSGRERALRDFLKTHGSAAEWALSYWLKGKCLPENELAERPEVLLALKDLDRQDVVRNVGGGWWVTDEARAIAAEMLEPMAFRLWREVDRARTDIAKLGNNQGVAIDLLVGRFGVETQQAGRFIQQNPIQPLMDIDRPDRPQASKTLWRAAHVRASPRPPPSNRPEVEASEAAVPVSGLETLNDASVDGPTNLHRLDNSRPVEDRVEHPVAVA